MQHQAIARLFSAEAAQTTAKYFKAHHSSRDNMLTSDHEEIQGLQKCLGSL